MHSVLEEGTFAKNLNNTNIFQSQSGLSMHIIQASKINKNISNNKSVNQ